VPPPCGGRSVSIIRAPRPTDSYLILRNSVALDERLSYRARGVLAAVLARPDSWRVDSTQLARQAREGREAIRAALRELEVCGYLRRAKSTDQSGKWSTDQVIYDTPQSTGDGKPGAGFPDVGGLGAHTKTGTKDGDQVTPPRRKNLGRPKIARASDVPAVTAPLPGGVDLSTGEVTSGGYVTEAGFYRAGVRAPEPDGW
jgi:hypothetical protein